MITSHHYDESFDIAWMQGKQLDLIAYLPLPHKLIDVETDISLS